VFIFASPFVQIVTGGTDIYRIAGIVNVMLPHWVDIGKPKQVKVVNSFSF
jgi:hypothetical protein